MLIILIASVLCLLLCVVEMGISSIEEEEVRISTMPEDEFLFKVGKHGVA